MSRIESDGITALRNFLSESKSITHYISENDRTPLRDGEIHIHKEANTTSKHTILGRIPVQIKCTKGFPEKKRTTISFRLPIEDLEKYRADGGILLIKVLFNSTTDYRIYAAALLPFNLKGYIDSNKPISLDLYENIQNFETICHHYLKNQPHQGLLRYDDFPMKSIPPDANLIISTIGNTDNPEMALFSEKAYFYLEPFDGVPIPADIQLEKVSRPQSIEVAVGNVIWFRQATIEYRKDGKRFFLNPALELCIKDDKPEFLIHDNRDTLFDDYSKAVSFLYTICLEKRFSVNGRVIYGNFSNFERVYSNHTQTEIINKLFEILRIESGRIGLKDINNSLWEINLLNTILLDKEPVNVSGTENNNLFKPFRLFDSDILLLLARKEDGTYTGNNFCTMNLSEEFSLTDRHTGETHTCSRYIAAGIWAQFRPEALGFIRNFTTEALEDLNRYYTESDDKLYIHFMLAMISVFDKTDYTEFLDLAYGIHRIVYRSDDNSAAYQINMLQIKKRKYGLDKSDRERLIKLKEDCAEEFSELCCINILLENFHEFEFYFEKLEDDMKEYFRSWPIWNLYRKQ